MSDSARLDLIVFGGLISICLNKLICWIFEDSEKQFSASQFLLDCRENKRIRLRKMKENDDERLKQLIVLVREKLSTQDSFTTTFYCNHVSLSIKKRLEQIFREEGFTTKWDKRYNLEISV